ncbi:hypothetical protein SEA_DAUBENSKI_247 [Streptomyces phage Daubenski]|uniref:Uncharacterized protein n=1 Tax=Streptomyces phage Daubenski TaxID=2653725 RepID=A0A5Q2WDM9_9CAUD|nr:hypothetical protein KNU80_gp003 [Streptomyces phage Daubenski]YP_010104971.1 hypothetical protein KNU80_gp058 [Streptomyces phage Daubenski]QGH76531.1 hypothetical protein SEA_DAUBENSKI_3 [Streptomyces phage Daubenski]QGH76537.1 hypothetical protein SEA_DAUBENSKI_247 [Streptomyces phage Daubenski]
MEAKMHGLEIGSKGQVAFASRNEPAWHNLGTVFEGELTTSEMLALAHLNGWDVRLESVKDILGMISDNYDFVTEPYMVVRTNPFNGRNDVLATVGEGTRSSRMRSCSASVTASSRVVARGRRLVPSVTVAWCSVLCPSLVTSSSVTTT